MATKCPAAGLSVETPIKPGFLCKESCFSNGGFVRTTGIVEKRREGAIVEIRVIACTQPGD